MVLTDGDGGVLPLRAAPGATERRRRDRIGPADGLSGTVERDFAAMRVKLLRGKDAAGVLLVYPSTLGEYGEWAVRRGSTSAATGGRLEPLADGLRGEADDAIGRRAVAAPFAQRLDRPGDVALDVAHVGRLAVGVGLAPADADEQAVVALRVGDVPATRARPLPSAEARP